MARKPRNETAAGLYHVTARGNNQRALFTDDRDYERYLRLLGKIAVHYRWRCLCYCLMPNHVHLLIETKEPNLGRGMGRLSGGYATDFNRRHGRRDHLFGQRFWSSDPIIDESYLRTAIAYIARNPVSASLCARPEDWLWSSHAAAVGGPAPTWLDLERLWELCGVWGGDGKDAYRRLVTPDVKDLSLLVC